MAQISHCGSPRDEFSADLTEENFRPRVLAMPCVLDQILSSGGRRRSCRSLRTLRPRRTRAYAKVTSVILRTYYFGPPAIQGRRRRGGPSRVAYSHGPMFFPPLRRVRGHWDDNAMTVAEHLHR